MVKRRLPVGAETSGGGGAHFRVWAPRRREVEVVIEGGPGDGSRTARLSGEPGGYFSGSVPGTGAGTIYRFRLDRGKDLFPDPASRCQPQGPHGPSMVIDPTRFRWTDSAWRGIDRKGSVVYELHVGTFTGGGTWQAASRELPELASAGITVVEMMPVAEFAGRFGWGYDGVDPFAPTRLYGEPDDLRRFVDRAHQLGLGVILDVVYNHLGPDGCYLREFSPDYFTRRYANDWGEAINFDGENSGPVREYFISSGASWIEEYHMDGLRLDATQDIHDSSPEHFLAALNRRLRESAPGRSIFLVAENEPQDVKLVKPLDAGGHGLDALWNDDFHHSAMVALTGRGEAYYSDYRGTPQELLSAARRGYLFQGQRSAWQKKPRGTSTAGIPLPTFVDYLQNHDQVANSGRGLRVHLLTSPGRHRALTALLLLAPGTPLLFQGQEFSASSPFLFFADHPPELAGRVREGRGKFLAQFRSLAGSEMQARLADPADPSTFERSKLDLSERDGHPEAYALHRDLLELRREDPVIRGQGDGGVDGAVIGPHAFALRLFGPGGSDRLLVVNLGRDLVREALAEPLAAPPAGHLWALAWSSEDPRYGGNGALPLESEGAWSIPGESAALLASRARS